MNLKKIALFIKQKIPYVIGILLLLTVVYFVYLYYLIERTTVTEGVANITIGKQINNKRLSIYKMDNCLYVEDFLFDTGCPITRYYSEEDKRINDNKIAIWGTIDTNRDFKFEVLSNSPELNYGTINVKNLLYKTQESVSSKVIGMNIISKCNWFIDLENKQIKSLKLSNEFDQSIIKDCKSFDYTLSIENKPYIEFDMNGIMVKDILFDTGYDGFISVTPEIIEKLSKKYTPNKYIRGQYAAFSISKVNMYRFPNVDFKEYWDTDSIDIVESSRNILGFKFFLNKKMIFLDNYNKRIYYK